MEARCPICWLPVQEDVFACPGCETRQHARCVESAGGCVVAGCTGRGKPSFKPPVAPAPAPKADVDADALAAEATAASMARLAEGAREARAARSQSAQEGKSQEELSVTPFGSEETWVEAENRRAAQVLARPGALPSGCAPVNPAIGPGAVGDPRRGWFGRVLDTAAESVAILPRIWPLIALTVAGGLVPTLTFLFGGGFTFWSSWYGTLLQYLVTLGPPMLLLPAVVLLILDPKHRRLSHSELVHQVVGTWPRFIPTAVALLAAIGVLSMVTLAIVMPLMRFDWSSMFAAVAVGGLVLAFLYGLFCLPLVVACTPRAQEPRNSMARGISLSCRHPFSAFGAVIAGVAIPMLIALMVQMSLSRATFGGSMAPLWITMTTVNTLLNRVWPMVYLSMLYGDLAAAERA